MKKFVKATALMAMALSLCACKMSAKTVKSDTGMIKVSIKNEEVTLNHVEYEFPEDYKIKEEMITEDIGISYVEVKNEDRDLIGVLSDGKYEEDIDEDNIAEAANDVYEKVHDVKENLGLTSDMFVYGDELAGITIGLQDGYAVFIAKLDTEEFVYIVVSEDDDDEVMEDCIKSVVEQLGSDEDYEIFFED